MKTYFKYCLKYFHTIRYLKFIQIKGQILKKLKLSSKSVQSIKVLNLRKKLGNFKQPIGKPISVLAPNKFRFLNETHSLKDLSNWSDNSLGDLWIYNLNYFDDLNAKDATKRKDIHLTQITNWIKFNTVSSRISWDPYPTSLRIVNWIKWKLLNNYELNIDQSLADQAEYLANNIETHLLGNHLLSNAKALIFAGFYFEGGKADSWLRVGLRILERQLKEQLHEDGGHFELSPMYHSIILEDLLDIYNLFSVYDFEPLKDQSRLSALMLKWLQVMTHPDGDLSFFNDSALGIAPKLSELESYLERLGLKAINQSLHGLTILESSGYSRVELKDCVAIIDRASIGPDYLPGHAHADSLSFELSLFKKRIIVNSGTSIYGEDLCLRKIQRSTSSHSTIEIDGENSSEVWGAFRVARRAKINEIISFNKESQIILSASHDGYKRLKGRPRHSRKWEFTNSSLSIYDLISGKGAHEINLMYHLHPEVKLGKDGNSIIINILDKKIQLEFEGINSIDILDSYYYPEFGKELETSKIVCKINGILPKEIITRMYW